MRPPVTGHPGVSFPFARRTNAANSLPARCNRPRRDQIATGFHEPSGEAYLPDVPVCRG